MAKHLFRSGDPKRGGRQKGTLNKRTVEGREFAEQLLNDPVYRRNLRERLVAGRVAPGVEAMLWHFAYGKPCASLELSGSVNDLATMSTSELVSELEQHQLATALLLAAHHGARTTSEQGD